MVPDLGALYWIEGSSTSPLIARGMSKPWQGRGRKPKCGARVSPRFSFFETFLCVSSWRKVLQSSNMSTCHVPSYKRQGHIEDLFNLVAMWNPFARVGLPTLKQYKPIMDRNSYCLPLSILPKGKVGVITDHTKGLRTINSSHECWDCIWGW